MTEKGDEKSKDHFDNHPYIFSIILFTILLIICVYFFTEIKNLKNDQKIILSKIKSINNNLNIVTVEITQINKKLNNFSESLFSLGRELEYLKKDYNITVNNFENSILNINKDIEYLKGSVLNIHRNISTLKTNVLYLKETLNDRTEELERLNSQIKETEKNLSKIKNKIEDISDNLNSKISSLNYDLESLSNNISYINYQLEQKMKDVQDLNDQISDLQYKLNLLDEKIKQKLIWVGENSKIDFNDDTEKSMYDLVYEKCLDDDTINLPCVWHVIHNIYGIEYIPDKGDTLYSLKHTIIEKGGDCEDLSLLFAAVVRSIPHKNTYYIIKSPGDKVITYREGNKYWYLSDYKLKSANGYNKIYVVCGLTKDNGGHCLNVICNSEFSKNIPVREYVNNFCIIVEPQSYGLVSDYMKTINFIITENDICADNDGKNFCLSDMPV